jgi:hypothetical protein
MPVAVERRLKILPLLINVSEVGGFGLVERRDGLWLEVVTDRRRRSNGSRLDRIWMYNSPLDRTSRHYL